MVKRTKRRFDLRKTLFLLPNMITLSSIFCGFDAIVVAARANGDEGQYYRAALLIVFAMVFDMLFVENQRDMNDVGALNTHERGPIWKAVRASA